MPEQVSILVDQIAADVREGCRLSPTGRARWRYRRTRAPAPGLGRMVLERMLAGVSTRRYPVALEPVGRGVDAQSRSTSTSAVSRKLVQPTHPGAFAAGRAAGAEPRSTGMSPSELSEPTATPTLSAQPGAHRAATEAPRHSGHPPWRRPSDGGHLRRCRDAQGRQPRSDSGGAGRDHASSTAALVRARRSRVETGPTT